MKILKTFMALAGVLLTPICILLLLFWFVLMTDQFMDSVCFSEQYNAADKLKITEEEARSAIHSMLQYVKGEADSPNTEILVRGKKTWFCNERELKHLEDIREMLVKAKIVMIVTCFLGPGIIIYLLWKGQKRLLGRCILSAEGIYLMAGAALVSRLKGRTLLFIARFHRLFFSDKSWIFNPARDRLVRFFPKQLYEKAIFYAAGAEITVFLIGLICAVFWLRSRKLPAYK